MQEEKPGGRENGLAPSASYGISALAVALLIWFLITLPESIREADQILNTSLLLLILAAYLIYDFRPELARPPQAQRSSLFWSGASILVALVSLAFPTGILKSLLLFISFSVQLRAVASCFLAKSSLPLLRALFMAFTTFGFLLISLPVLDMPLRLIAGRWSATLFTWLKQDVELTLIQDHLILVLNGTPYHVAAECNGFGLLGTTLILTTAFILYRKVKIPDAVLLIIAAIIVSLVGNLVRIFFILIFAPHVGDHYMLMHEIVGIIAFYTFLALQWWLVVGFGKTPRKDSQSIQTDSRINHL